MDRYREATLRPRVRDERGVVGDGDGADDGQSEAVVVIDAGESLKGSKRRSTCSGGIAAAILIGAFAGLMPAVRASRMPPTVALRTA